MGVLPVVSRHSRLFFAALAAREAAAAKEEGKDTGTPCSVLRVGASKRISKVGFGCGLLIPQVQYDELNPQPDRIRPFPTPSFEISYRRFKFGHFWHFFGNSYLNIFDSRIIVGYSIDPESPTSRPGEPSEASPTGAQWLIVIESLVSMKKSNLGSLYDLNF